MKTLKFRKMNFVLIVVISFIFSSCQKVINVDTRDTDRKYVVEAVVTDEPGDSEVRISSTQHISDTAAFTGISGAIVRITDHAGVQTIFQETASGQYTAPSFTGISGTRYNLQVEVGGEKITAECTMPPRISFDTLYVTDEILFGETRKLANIAFQDPSGKGQAYRYVQFINGHKTNAIFTNNDDYIDGKYVETKLWYIVDDDDEHEKIKSGDSVMIEMQCIDPRIYRYWFSVFQSATGNSQSASPANPVSNIQGGALGYFSAHTVERRSVVVQ